MDNLTHTLTGLLIAETGLKRRTRLGTATLMIGANLPDIDAAVFLWGDGLDGLEVRRGWTHGILAMVVLPAFLWLLMRWWARRGPAGVPPADTRWLFALCCVGVWSHPLLDLFNTYGVRLLMPFSATWFRGDTLFILDPILILILAVGIVWARARSAPRAARGACVAAVGYVGLMAAGSAVGRATVRDQGQDLALGTMAAPLAMAPFRREVVRRLPGAYETGIVELGSSSRYHATTRVADGADQAWAKWAATTDRGRRFLAWSRYPRFVIDSFEGTPFGVIYDMRYGDGITGTWASVEFTLPPAVLSP
jgi:inner membrane protein